VSPIDIDIDLDRDSDRDRDSDMNRDRDSARKVRRGGDGMRPERARGWRFASWPVAEMIGFYS